MNQSRQGKRSYAAYHDLNSMIISGNIPPKDKKEISNDMFVSRMKQIKYLRRFQELFRKQFLEKERKNQFIKDTIKSNFQESNRLKGMFVLKKRTDLSEKRSKNQFKDEQEINQTINKPLQGKSLQQTNNEVEQKAKTLSTDKKLTNYIANRTQSGQNISKMIIPIKRPVTRLDQTISTPKLFNNDTISYLVQKVNKICINNLPNTNSFAYFSVYIQDGNNSQMIKAAIRKRSGWRVVQLPSVANMVWSQFYKTNFDVKLTRKIKQFQPGVYSIDTKTSSAKNYSNLLPGLDDLSPYFKPKRIEQHRKSLEGNPNLLSQQDYNKQMKKLCPYEQHLSRTPTYAMNSSYTTFFYNHIPNHHCISDKKHLLGNMHRLYRNQKRNVFEIMPYSVQITQDQIENIQSLISGYADDQYWIIKPGQNSNRGRGIVVCKGAQAVVQEITNRFSSKNTDGDNQKEESPLKIQKKYKKKQQQSYIVQKYLQPLLYQKRKFDIRMYMLVTLVNKKLRGYIYEQGYIRTSCKQYNSENFNKYIHLTNDAVQSRSSDYGKYQEGNKISWKKFQNWLIDQGKQGFFPKFQQKTKAICKDILVSAKDKFIKQYQKKKHLRVKKTSQYKRNSMQYNSSDSEINQGNKIYFQVYGLDFFIDCNMNIWLIQVNTNPALTTDCSRVVHTLIPKMIDNAFTIAIEPFTKITKQSDNYKFDNKFVAIYDDQWQNC